MKHRNESKCWYCGSLEVEPDDRGVKCRLCGATWNYVPQPGAQVITTDKAPRLYRPTRNSPSGYLQRLVDVEKVAKARTSKSIEV